MFNLCLNRKELVFLIGDIQLRCFRESLLRVEILFLADNAGRVAEAVFFQAKIYRFIYTRSSVFLFNNLTNS